MFGHVITGQLYNKVSSKTSPTDFWGKHNLEQFSNLQDFENYLWSNRIPSYQVSSAFDQLVALTCEDMFFVCVFSTEWNKRHTFTGRPS